MAVTIDERDEANERHAMLRQMFVDYVLSRKQIDRLLPSSQASLAFKFPVSFLACPIRNMGLSVRSPVCEASICS